LQQELNQSVLLFSVVRWLRCFFGTNTSSATV